MRTTNNYTPLMACSLLLAISFLASGQVNPQTKFASAGQEPGKMVVDGFYYIDAEDFDDFGGWQMDNQFVHFMGSPYLIAAGVGTPVKDAATTINIFKSGQYHVWIRDRNWEQEFAPGRFRVLVNGTPLKMEFGAAPSDNWTWEYGGKVKLKKGSVDLALHDITGFYGRCDAIVLTTDANYIPPEEKDEVCEERARLKGLSLEPSFMGEYDVIVVGGGSAGVPAAIAAARTGAKTALIQNRPVLGGNSSEELGVAIVGAGFNHPGWRETGIIEEAELLRVNIGQSNSSKAFKQLCDAEENLTLFLNQHVFDAMMETGKEIKGVKAVSTLTGKISEYTGKIFIDCTGDGWLGYFSGAAYRYGRESKDEFNESLAPETADHITMSGCLMGGTNFGFGTAFRSRKAEHPVAYFRPPWAREIHDLVGYGRRVHQIDAGNWWMEHEGTVDDLFDPEHARDELIKVTFSFWDFIKNKGDMWDYASDKKGQEDDVKYYELETIPIVNARRETRRLEGDYLVTQNDVLSGRMFPDRIAYAGWPLDIHHPEGIYSGPEGSFQFDIVAPINSIPFRSVYSKNIDNLLFAGRCGSFTHLGLGSVRVQSTLGMIGQAAGTAAAMCVQKEVYPRGIYENHMNELQQTLLKYDQSIPGLKNEDPDDLARNATVTASSNFKEKDQKIEKPTIRKSLSVKADDQFVIVPISNTNPTELVKVYIKSTNRIPTKIQVYADGGKKAEEQEVFIGEYALSVPAYAQKWFEIPFDHNNFADYDFLKIRVSETDGIQWPAVYWIVRNEEADHADYSPQNVTNGWVRLAENNHSQWRTDPSQPFPQWLELDFGEPTKINTIHLTFDTDLTTGQPNKSRQVVCVKSYDVFALLNGKWEKIAECGDNFRRHKIHRFEKISVSKIKIIIKETYGAPSARVYEVRVYNE